MKREIYQKLVQWKNNENKKPLIIKGARQVGKTYIIRQFGKDCYETVVEVNFERDLKFKTLFQETHNPKEILQYFKFEFPNAKFDQNTLIFMDEIQACEDALTSLKFIKEEFNCDVICSGSLLGIAIAKSSSYPVRYTETLNMFPMTFIEFLNALNIDSDILNSVRNAVHTNIKINPMIHDKMIELFKTYIKIGGMPEVVQEYVMHNDYLKCIDIQRAIVNDYLADMIKYSTNSEAIKIRECFESIPLQLAKENKKFQYGVVKKGYNARHYEESLKWLIDAGLVIKVNRLEKIDYPLKAYQELPIFKIYMGDTGLLLSSFSDTDIRKVMQGDLNIYKGAIYENIVAQILNHKNIETYYYEPSQSSEIDFVIEYHDDITPIEVKSGENTNSRSFNNFIKKHNSKCAFRLSMKNIGENEGIRYLPLYALAFLEA